MLFYHVAFISVGIEIFSSGTINDTPPRLKTLTSQLP